MNMNMAMTITVTVTVTMTATQTDNVAPLTIMEAEARLQNATKYARGNTHALLTRLPPRWQSHDERSGQRVSAERGTRAEQTPAGTGD